MANPVLCVDVGNSRTKFGLFPSATGECRNVLPDCALDLAVRHREPVVWEAVKERLSLSDGQVVNGFISGSHPDGIASLVEDWPSDWTPPTVVDDLSRIPEAIRPHAPRNAGMDRILKAVACNVVRPPNQPALVIDTGTATCVDAISADGAFEGGAILPGFELCARALHQYTALLPYITVDELLEESHESLGQGTREALRSGLLWGQVGAIKELIVRLGRRWTVEPFLLLTGGGASLLTAHLPGALWKPQLSLQGLAVVAAKRRGSGP
ncbi:MAG TPA: type III pantothenate kinase [Planctomycetaceae bacterium]|nr:type III pantothenate kinase [Planctomycetaceae bacterium]